MDNGCTTAILTPPSYTVGPYYYSVVQPTLNQVLPELNTTAPGCSINRLLTNADNTSVDPALIISYVSSTNTMQVYTTDNGKVGEYELKLNGTMAFGNGTAFYIFKLIIRHQCTES